MHSNSTPAQRLAPRLVGLGLTIVLAAQLSPGVPVAGAIAICGWGTVLWAGRPWVPVVLATYVPLAGLAIAAQLHPAASVDLEFATVDAVAAMLLVVLLTRYAFARLTA